MTTETTPCPGLAPHREARGLTQEQAAADAQVSRRQYQRYEETGEAPTDTLVWLAGVWDLTFADLTRSPTPGPDRQLARQARLHREACEEIRDQYGKAAYRAARARVVAADPGAMLPE